MRIREQLITPPTTLPVTVAEFKEWAGVYYSPAENEAKITSLLTAATKSLENETGRAFITQEWKAVLDRFPRGRTIELGRSPLQIEGGSPVAPLTTVKYVDVDGVQQTLPAEYYTVDAVSEPGRIVLNPGYCWSQTKCVANAVEITYTAGWPTANEVPDGIKTLVKFLTNVWYDNPLPLSDKNMLPIPRTLEHLVADWRVVTYPVVAEE